MQRIPELYFGKSEIHGRGVFAAGDIVAGSLLEVCPVIIIPREQLPSIDATVLHDYYFFWGEEEQDACIVLGLGSLFNHSDKPNAECVPDYEHQNFQYFASRDIKAGEELTIDYNGGDAANDLLWFDAD